MPFKPSTVSSFNERMSSFSVRNTPSRFPSSAYSAFSPPQVTSFHCGNWMWSSSAFFSKSAFNHKPVSTRCKMAASSKLALVMVENKASGMKSSALLYMVLSTFPISWAIVPTPRTMLSNKSCHKLVSAFLPQTP